MNAEKEQLLWVADFPLSCSYDKKAPFWFRPHFQGDWFYCTLPLQTFPKSKREKVCELSVSSKKGCIAMFVNALVTSGKDFQASHAIFFPLPEKPDVISPCEAVEDWQC